MNPHRACFPAAEAYGPSACVLVAVVALAAGAGSTLGQQATFAGKVIRRITVEGLVRTPEAEVLGRMRIRLGERFDPEVVEQEAGRLFALGKFERVLGPYVSEFEDGVAVRFVVAEKPLVLRLQFRGRESISESDLVTGTPSLRTKEGDLYNSYLARQDEDTIRNKYLDEGYLFVAVDHVAETTSRGVIVTFVIAEGTRVRIREIKFLGNRSVPDGDLLDVMSTREKGFGLLQLFWPGFFNYRTLEADAVAIKRYYRRLGFLDAQAEPEDVQLDPDQERMIITIRVDEGPRFTFRGYQLSGNSVFSDQTLRDLTTAPVGSPYDETRMESDRQAILDYYKDRAYIFAEVERRFVFSETGADVFVAFDIEENNEIHINEVRVRGNLKTKDEVVRRELDFHPGERIDNSKLVKSRSNLARLQIFRDIQYTYEATGQPSSRNVVVNVDEAGRGQMIFGVGVTSHFGVVGNLEITLRNFDLFDWPQSFYDIPEAWTGAGQTLRLVVRPGTRFSRYVLTFIEPYLFDTRNELALSFQSVDVLREDWEEGRTSFQPTVTHRFDFDRDLSIAFGARLSEIEVSDIESDAPDDVFESEGHTTVIGLNVGMEYDKRLIEPFEGAYDGHEEGASYHYYGDFLGGDVDYHSFHLHQDLFFPLYTVRDWNAHHVITFRARYGWMRPFDESDTIPIFERFFLGGPQDVRGFRFRGVGPHENGEPVGGTSELWGTLEYSFPIFQKLLRGVAFLDYGNLDELSNFRLETMRVAAGGGLRINFPFFGGYPLPIGLYFGHPIREEPEDESRLFLFSIGDAF